MKQSKTTRLGLPVAGFLFVLAACTEKDTYPLTGKACGPEDAVQELDANECAINPASSPGTF